LAHAIALEAVTPSLSLGKAANAMLNSQFHCLPAKRSGASLTSCSRGRRIFRSASEIPSAAPLNAGVRLLAHSLSTVIMRTIIATFIAFAFTQGAMAGINSYQCVIKEHLDLSKAGVLDRPPKPYYIGQRFAVDRMSGVFTGPEQVLTFPDSTYRVLARGNAKNAFSVVATTANASGGMHFTVITIEEFVEGTAKPFALQNGSSVLSGVCE
jgi:hypothetical protein